ncbi:ThiF family adenylyltransferase [Paenibacillus thermotolerans]|uniref:ThiF family adenylyltransferase n=1 Tax=Paenibacillus thermotolerans TaxID=3027807 RepID=UPI002368C2B8|nr:MULTISPECIES: ThiF family adenylyltransferase [unclassified Paenibacillus]
MTEPDIERYSRQMLFRPIGAEGQQKLAASKVLIVGMGALGAVLANHMARSGVGKLRIVDRDYVERSNLQRQMLYDEDDADQAMPKAAAAARKLGKINSSVRIEPIVADVTAGNIEKLMNGCDLVLDGTDNFQTRLLLNDACFKQGVPFVYGGAVSSQGMTAVFIPGETCCIRCLIGDSEGNGQTCDTIGVISPVVDIVASYQSVEAIKYLVGARSAMRRGLLSIELWQHQVFEMKLPPVKADCPTCGRNMYPALEIDANPVAVMCGRDTVQIQGAKPLELDQWEQKLSKVCRVSRNMFLLKADVTDKEKLVLFPDGRVLVQGTEDMARARTLYDRYIGN